MFTYAKAPLAVVTVRGIAAWLQRAWRTTDQDLLADLRILAEATPRLVAAATRFALPVGDGVWIGKVAEAAGQGRFCAVGSYLVDDGAAP